MGILSEAEFIKTIEKIESFYLEKDTYKVLRGRIVYYFDDYVDRQSEITLATKVEDIESITKQPINRTFIGDIDGSGLLQITTIRRPKPKEFRGIYKFVPNNAIVVENDGTDNKGKAYHYKVCAIQKEDGSIKILNRNKAITEPSYHLSNDYCEFEELTAWWLINNYFDITESHGIAYDFNNTTFIFPMSLKDMKEAFVNRGKDNLRKSVLPTSVKRGDKTFIRMGNNGFNLGTRHFYYATGLIGTEYLSISNKRNLVDRGYEYQDKYAMAISKDKERAVVVGEFA